MENFYYIIIGASQPNVSHWVQRFNDWEKYAATAYAQSFLFKERSFNWQCIYHKFHAAKLKIYGQTIFYLLINPKYNFIWSTFNFYWLLGLVVRKMLRCRSAVGITSPLFEM